MMQKKIIWAVDPFAKEHSLQRSTAWAIKTITRGFDSVIEPIYFFSAYLTEGPVLLQNEWARSIQLNGQKELNKILHRVQLENVKPLHIICHPYLSMREGIERINEVANRWGADLIVSSTHARKGVARLVLGSFAETLLLHSNVPLLFVNPRWKRQYKFKHVLFPTDFSNESHEAYLKILDYVKGLNCSLTLFHKLLYTWPSVVEFPEETASLYEDAFGVELKSKNEFASQWAKEAKAKGVDVQIDIDFKSSDSVVQTILAKAHRNPGLIALASKSGVTRTVLLGSLTRKIVRESPFPVWVLHQAERPLERGQHLVALEKAPSQTPEKGIYSVAEEDVVDELHIPIRKKQA